MPRNVEELGADARTVPLARAGRVALDLACVAVALAALTVLLPGFVGIQRYVITGGSMSGTFEPGAVVFEREASVDDLRVGDVITYLPPGTSGVGNLVTHRIVEIERDADSAAVFRTKGDANASADPWMFTIDAPTQQRVVLAVEGLGWPLIWLADPSLRLLLIGGPAAAIFLIAARQLSCGLRATSDLAQRHRVST